MTITIAFVCVVAAVLAGGLLYRRWDEARHLRFTDEAGSSAAIAALARFEARKVVTHPTWLITLGFVTLVVGVLMIMDPGNSADATMPATWFALLGLPLAGLALVVSTHRIGCRSRRNSTDELEAATPTAPRTRTGALLLACCAAVPVLAGAIAAGLVISQLDSPLTPSPTVENLVPLAGFLLAGLGGAVVGVLLSRWLPFALAPLLGIVAIIWLNNGPDHLHPRFRWLRVAVESNVGGRFDIGPDGLLAAFILGLVALGSCLALWRHRPGVRMLAATGAAIAVLVTTGWTMTRSPSPEQVAAVVDELEHPAAHQRCVERAGVRYCVYPGAESWVDAWAPGVDGVLAQIPVAERPDRVEVTQRPVIDPRNFLKEVRTAIDPARVWPADGRVHPAVEFEGTVAALEVAWQTAALAVGLPPSPDWQHPAGCMAGGQARLVLADVLSARATATTRRAMHEVAQSVVGDGRHLQPVPVEVSGEYDVDNAQVEGSEVRPGERRAADGITHVDYLTPLGATGWGSDVLAAQTLADADRATVDAVIADHWMELVDAATPTTRFLELVGVSVSGPKGRTMSTADPSACR